MDTPREVNRDESTINEFLEIQERSQSNNPNNRLGQERTKYYGITIGTVTGIWNMISRLNGQFTFFKQIYNQAVDDRKEALNHYMTMKNAIATSAWSFISYIHAERLKFGNIGMFPLENFNSTMHAVVDQYNINSDAVDIGLKLINATALHIKKLEDGGLIQTQRALENRLFDFMEEIKILYDSTHPLAIMYDKPAQGAASNYWKGMYFAIVELQFFWQILQTMLILVGLYFAFPRLKIAFRLFKLSSSDNTMIDTTIEQLRTVLRETLSSPCSLTRTCARSTPAV
jgi:hypothetical protein